MKRTITIKSEVLVTVGSPVGAYNTREEWLNAVNENMLAMQTELFRDSVVEEIVRCFDGSFEEVSAELKQLEVK